MPGEVGAGSFWKGMTDWVSGAADLDTVLAEIDASWPAGVSGETSCRRRRRDGAFPVLPGGFLEKAMAGEYAGTTVIVDGPFTDVDEVKFKESMKAFEEATGIDRQLHRQQRVRRLHLHPRRRRRRPRHRRLSAARPAGQLCPPGQDRRPDHLHPRGLAEAAVQPELAGHGQDASRTAR